MLKTFSYFLRNRDLVVTNTVYIPQLGNPSDRFYFSITTFSSSAGHRTIEHLVPLQ